MESFVGIRVKVFRDPGNESDHGLFVTVYCLNEPQIILIDSSSDPDPLMDLKPLFLDNLTGFHDFCHFIDRNHLYRPEVDSAQPLEDLLNVLRLVSLAVDDASGQLRLENF